MVLKRNRVLENKDSESKDSDKAYQEVSCVIVCAGQRIDRRG